MIRLLWPLQIRYRGKNANPTMDTHGRRYGHHTWLSISLGHLHFNVLPAHVRGIWASVYLKEAWRG